MKMKYIGKFEEKNGINVNVFSYDDETSNIFTLRISKDDNDECVNLFLYDNHYSLINYISRLVSSQLNGKEHKKHICLRCLNAFGSSELLTEHLELCKNYDYQRHIYPSKKIGGGKPTVFFENIHRQHRVPFVVYADFESFIEPIDNTTTKDPNKSHTTKYQKHTPSGFCYTIKCFDENIYKNKTVLYTAEEEGDDIGRKFVEYLEEDLKEVYEKLRVDKPVNVTMEDNRTFKNAKECYACKLPLGDDRTRDYCHLTSKYLGAIHAKCKLRTRTPKFIPILFHNLEGYDSHLFIKSLGLSEGNIKCIPKTDEKYISFSKTVVMDTYIDSDGDEKNRSLEIRFLDSLKFTLSSLDSLVKNLGKDQFGTLEGEMGTNDLLKKKGVFPYEYMSDYTKLQEDTLPPKEEFYSKLNNTDISDDEYEHAKKVWETFNCKTMRDYHDLYLKTDVLLLADVMENYI